MNSTLSFPTLPNPPSELPLLYVEERDGRIAAFVFRGDVKHVDRVLKMWASGKFTSAPPEDGTHYTIMSDDKMIATVARDNMHCHRYIVRLMD